jgi:Arc/MetJ family transcription regulator
MSSVRTMIRLDEDLFAELMRFTQASTKVEAVLSALDEYIRLRRKEELLALRGKLDVEDNWRELRALELDEV